MPSLSETTVIPAPPDVVWPLLRDPDVVASCIPGAELSPDSGGDTWRGSIRVKFGPTVATFRGEAVLNFDDSSKTCTVEGRGIDQRGASRALASGRFSLTGTNETTLSVEGEFNVTGPLETFANAGGVHVAQALLAEFSKNLSARAAAADDRQTGGAETAESAAPASPAGAPAAQPKAGPAPARELNAISLLWKALKSMITGLFARKGQ